MKSYDLLIIGGGIHGAGIALDAAGRGLSVLLCEQGDLASGTSSMSSKLIHGGLRYLEQGDFRLVFNGLRERRILLKRAPHLVHPLGFIMPWQPGDRSKYMIRLGLWFYDALAYHSGIPKSSFISLSHSPIPLKPQFKEGFQYYDCQSNDARLVMLNAIGAREKGAQIVTHTRYCNAVRKAKAWEVRLWDERAQTYFTIETRGIINAAGPWVDNVLQQGLTQDSRPRARLVKGSHLILRKLYPEHHGYLLPHVDGRVIFVIPYANDYTLIGTTDVAYNDGPGKVVMEENECHYLLDAVNQYFAKQLVPEDVIGHYSGIRSLKREDETSPAKNTRDFFIEVEHREGSLPCATLVGGKLTTYRRAAEAVLEKLRPFFPEMGAPWTANALLPGGDIGGSLNAFCLQLAQQYPWLDEKILRRYGYFYGTRCHIFLKGKIQQKELGTHYGHGLYQAEIEYLKTQEWATTVEDVLWRRSNLGLVFTAQEVEHLRSVWDLI